MEFLFFRYLFSLASDDRETLSSSAEAISMRLPQRLTIRLKILIVTAALLLIFALTNILSIRLSKGVVNELDTITDYFMPLSAIASKIDIDTFEFERFSRSTTLESAIS